MKTFIPTILLLSTLAPAGAQSTAEPATEVRGSAAVSSDQSPPRTADAAARPIRKELEQAQRKLAQAQEFLALHGAGGTAGSYSVLNLGREAVPPVVLRFSSSDAETTRMIEEDLAVMTRILEKALEGSLGEDAPPVKMGVRLLLTSASHAVRTMYVENFGALFMVKVNFPLLPPPRSDAKKAPTSMTSEWDQTRKELERTPTDAGWMAGSAGEYDATQVEELKKVLLFALKQASNIRKIKPDEFIALSVFGSSPPTLRPMGGGMGASIGGGYGNGMSGGYGSGINGAPQAGRKAALPSGTGEAVNSNRPVPPGVREQKPGSTTGQPDDAPSAPAGVAAASPVPAGLPRNPDSFLRYGTLLRSEAGTGTVLTLRVVKADADAFAKGALSFEEFQKKASVHAYAGQGHGLSSVNSWQQTTGGFAPRAR
jgi:hypothetical protein